MSFDYSVSDSTNGSKDSGSNSYHHSSIVGSAIAHYDCLKNVSESMPPLQDIESFTLITAEPDSKTFKPDFINQDHWHELTVERGLSPDWVAANCKSMSCSEVSTHLYCKAKSDGIWIEGSRSPQGQFKPDKPWRTKGSKKAAKYLTPSKDDYDAILPTPPNDPNFWTDIEKLKQKAYNIDGNPCLLITEGGFKAIAGCSNGLPTLGLCGVEQGLTSSKKDPQGKRYLIKQLEVYANYGFSFLIAFDADCATNENVVNAEIKLAARLDQMGVSVYSVTGNWNEEAGKGMDDYIQNHGIEEFRQRLIDADLVREKYRNDDDDETETKAKKEKELTDKELIQYCRDRLNLRFNELTREIEINGEIISIEPYLYLVDEHDINVGKDKAADIFMMVAKENTYNPVKDYLESLKVAPIDITNLASRYLGTDNPLYDLFIEKMLIGAVARAYQPGCKLDTALVLQGSQGVGKSSFFDVLGGDYFDDSMGNGSDKDDLLTFHRSWIQEWGELDRIFGKKAVGEVKGFLSKRKDIFREPYARKTETFLRHSIIVGSVNDASFLNDPTGDRRFWVIPVETDKIDIPLLKKERDQIWAAALQAYKSGKNWWLSKDEEAQSAANNQQFQIQDEWQASIENYLNSSKETTIHEILENAFNLYPKDMDKSSQNRVGNILRSMGWKRSRKMVNGKRTYIYQAPGTSSQQGIASPALPALPLNSEAGQAGTPSQQGIASPALPALPKSETLMDNNSDREKENNPIKHSLAEPVEEDNIEEGKGLKKGEAGEAGEAMPHESGSVAAALPQSKGEAGEAGEADNWINPEIDAIDIGDKVWREDEKEWGDVVGIDINLGMIQVDCNLSFGWVAIESVLVPAKSSGD